MRHRHAQLRRQSFQFHSGTQQQLIGELSGGERNRVHLAKVLRAGANVLLLDEPTNDLDVESAAPRNFEGGAVEFPRLRDRDFARPLVSRSHRKPHSRSEGDSEVVWFQGISTTISRI